MKVNSNLYSILLYALMGISSILFLLFMLTDLVGEGLMLNWAFLLLGASVLIAIVFSVLGMVKDFGKAKYSIMGTGALILIDVIWYVVSTDESYSIGERVVEGSASQQSEAGLITFYVMIILAVVAIVYTEVSKAFK